MEKTICRPRQKPEDDIKIGLNETGYSNLQKWVKVTQDRSTRWCFVNRYELMGLLQHYKKVQTFGFRVAEVWINFGQTMCYVMSLKNLCVFSDWPIYIWKSQSYIFWSVYCQVITLSLYEPMLPTAMWKKCSVQSFKVNRAASNYKNKNITC